MTDHPEEAPKMAMIRRSEFSVSSPGTVGMSVCVSWPEGMLRADLEDVKQWLALVVKQMERSAEVSAVEG